MIEKDMNAQRSWASVSRPERHDNLPKRLYPANTPDNEQPSVYSHPNAMLKPNNAARNTSKSPIWTVRFQTLTNLAPAQLPTLRQLPQQNSLPARDTHTMAAGRPDRWRGISRMFGSVFAMLVLGTKQPRMKSRLVKRRFLTFPKEWIADAV
jgi:hypothetical protein